MARVEVCTSPSTANVQPRYGDIRIHGTRRFNQTNRNKRTSCSHLRHLQPLPNSVAHYVYFVKDLCFYVLLILSPIIFGMFLGICLESIASINTPLEFSSLPWTWVAMTITLAQGLVFSFLASALWMRGRPYTILGPVLIVIFGILAGVGVLDLELVLLGLNVQSSQSITAALISIVFCLGLGFLSSKLIIDDFDVSVVEKGDMLEPIYQKLNFLGKGDVRLIVAKEFVDLFRSGSIKKDDSILFYPTISSSWDGLVNRFRRSTNSDKFTFLCAISRFLWIQFLFMVDNSRFTRIYEWPTNKRSTIDRAKVVVYFLATSWISLIFIVLMAWRLDEWASLPTSIIVMFANSIYIVALTAFLMGLRPNQAIFDASIMVWFWIGTVLPLLGLFLLSFTQGDVSLYGNWWERASQDGLAATATMYDESLVQEGYIGMISISVGLLFASGLLWKLMDKRWGKTHFIN